MEKTSVVFADFEKCQLQPPIKQKTLLSYTAWLMATASCVDQNITDKQKANEIFISTKEALNKYGVSDDFIYQRQFTIAPETLGEPNGDKLPSVYPDLENNPNGEFLNSRLFIFKKKVDELFEFFYEKIDTPPDDIIHVTCAGYLSPSPAQECALKKKWHQTHITHSYHMGCYGAFPAVRMATGFLASSHHSLARKKSQIDIVHSEFVSIHFNITDQDPNNIVNMTLFGDGFIKYSAYPENIFHETKKSGLKLLASHEQLLPDSLGEMTWIPGPYQFDMYLSKNVPIFIRDHINDFMITFCSQLNIDFEKEKSTILFAIHPGGPKIVQHIKDVLNLTEEQIRFSKKVFMENGNMSSATVPHIWKEIVESDTVPKGQKIISVGFGPGLTAAGLIFEKV